jgi:hypothetical protein
LQAIVLPQGAQHLDSRQGKRKAVFSTHWPTPAGQGAGRARSIGLDTATLQALLTGSPQRVSRCSGTTPGCDADGAT